MLEDEFFTWGTIMVLKITFTSSDERGIVNAIGPVSVSKLLSVIAGIPQEDIDDDEEEEELIMCK